MQHHALWGVQRNGVRVGHRVRDRDELDVERPDPPPFEVADRDQCGPPEQPRFLDPVPRQPERHSRAEDREAQFAEQVLQRADVVLVAVGDDTAFDAVCVLAELGEVREHQVDPVHVGIGEHQPTVDEQDAVIVPQNPKTP